VANKTLRLRMCLVGAIVVALILALMPKMNLPWPASAQDAGDFVTVLVADRYVPAFGAIKFSSVRLQEFPKPLVPPGALHSKADLQNEAEQPLFVAAVPIPEGQPITRTVVVDASQNDTLASLIRPGKVAVSFEIDKAHGVGGWIRPGDTVALFSSVPIDMKGFRPLGKKTRLLLPSVAVLAVDALRLGQSKDKPQDGASEAAMMDVPLPTDSKIVTVLVGPTEASAIIEAREQGSLSVVLRSLGDEFPWPGNHE
jgi:pilus assembly protein CpaB